MNEHSLRLLRRIAGVGVMYRGQAGNAHVLKILIGSGYVTGDDEFLHATDAGFAFIAGVDHVLEAM